MTNDEDMLDLKHVNGELKYRQAIEVCVYHHIGHVSVHKQLTRHQVNNLIGRYPTVRAANPEVLWCLLVGQAVKKLRVLALDAIGPGLVIVQQMIKLPHQTSS